MKLNEVLSKSIQFFKDKKIESARLDAELLISHALKIPRIELYLKFDKPLSEEEIVLCREFIKRRSQGEPVAYIIEEKGFFGFTFKTKPGVLIPRPETEGIVETALEYIKKNKLTQPKILDLGAGTGCIGFSILKSLIDENKKTAASTLDEVKTLKPYLVSIEKSAEACAILTENQKQLELTENSEIIHSDVNTFDFLQLKNKYGAFDIIVANPPYIAEDDTETEAYVKKFEPSQALFAQDQGYELLKIWSRKTVEVLNDRGLMMFEMGYKQGEVMQQHFEALNTFKKVEVIKDLSKLDRFILGEKF